MRTIFCALLVTTALATAASAQDAGTNRNGYRQIMAGDLGRAQTLLIEQHRRFPEDIAVTLNLAMVYAQAGRNDLAREMYREALDRPDEQLDMANTRIAWSHDIATRGLQRLEAHLTTR